MTLLEKIASATFRKLEAKIISLGETNVKAK
jgi:hypothetical protein